jgi:hypothetical protein
MIDTSATTDPIAASWGRISQAIKTAVDAHPWEQMPTVFLETFQAQCRHEGEVMIATGTIAAIFPETNTSDMTNPGFQTKLFKKIEKLHGSEMNELLMSYLFTVDREALKGEVASTISDALSILHALHTKWRGEGSYSAPEIAYALWHLNDELNDFFPDLAQMAYAHLNSLRSYYDHLNGKTEADEIWISHSLSKKTGLMERLETLGQLARTEPAPIIEAFLKERASIDISALGPLTVKNISA